MWGLGMLWKRCDVEGFLLLFTENMMLVLMGSSSSLLGLSVNIMYFLTQLAWSLLIGLQFHIIAKSSMYTMF